MRLLLCSLVLCLAMTGFASAQGLAIVRVTESGRLERGPLQARVGEAVTLRVVQVRRGRRLSPLAPETRVQWFRIVPHMQHRDTPPPNEGIAQYSNSVLFGARHGRWLGYDTIEYETVALEATGAELTVDRVTDVGGSAGGGFGGAGSSWYAAIATDAEGATVRTADARDADHLGLSPAVLRVSFRSDDSYLGWLSTYFHVPNVFGSTGPQADRYVGADCADVLVGAHRASGVRSARYASVGGIATVASPVSPVLVLGVDGRARDPEGQEVALRWGEEVTPGDLFAIDYSAAGAQLPRPWDHIGALVGDANGDGVLDGQDRLRHMTPGGLLDRPLSSEGPIRFRVWRLKP